VCEINGDEEGELRLFYRGNRTLAAIQFHIDKGKVKMHDNVFDESKDITILELLDRVLNKGVILTGDIVISVADIDLVYLGVKLMLSSVETMDQIKASKGIIKK
jgi:hypothetical protein